jgi:hypothetical protein
LARFSNYEEEAKRRLEAFVEKEVPKDLLKRLESVNWPTLLGEKGFKEKIKEKYLGEEIDIKEKPAYRRDIIRFGRAKIKEDIERLVLDSPEILRCKRIRKYTKKRRALIYLLRRHYALSHKEISGIMGGVTYSAVSMQYKAAEDDMKKKKGCYKNVKEMAKLFKFKIKT